MKELVKNYTQLVKFRLTSTVVATSVFGYILGCKINSSVPWTENFEWLTFLGVLFGGMLVVFSSNGLNQVIEKENDSKMLRTSTRPIVEGRISLEHARVFSLVTGVLGVLILAVTTNFTATLLGLISLAVYVFIYTPMKQVSPFAVMVGAIPGALPPLIGYTAVIPGIDEPGIMLFLVQFFWQFPHFWAIAWLLHDDYQKAGYWLLPSKGGRDARSAMQIVTYSIILCLVSMMPVYYNLCGPWALTIITPISLYFCFKAFRLLKTLDQKEAKKLLYSSFLFTPLIFLAYILF